MEDTIEKKNFLCGVIEGFYGRPWTTEQRKDLFRKLKKWGMNSYVYAPKDDYKHRAYWRELYTVEEADHLTSLISAAKEHGIVFYYALSPGLDMTYSNQKEIQTLKRKLDQVSHFGCEAFALLFDDIESELSKVDKEVFQTFANAQVSVTNDIFTHLGNPKFFFCPTQYCTSRAVPNIQDSEYLNTLGSKLNHDIDIMWTGNRVISKTITLEAIEEITEVLRRPPVIWDNLHANDYDQKRVFLGPYTGRSPELIPHLKGVMTNPNCEFHANTIAIHTLAFWSQCNMDSKINSTLSADIKLETENEDGTTIEDVAKDCCLSKKIYHPRIALKNALTEWLPEFSIKKEAWGPITKPQPQVTMVMPIIPIIPSINTCMSLTTTTTTTSTSSKAVAVPEVNTTQLQALADVCSTVSSSILSPIANPVMNSLVSPTKVITNDEIYNPITNTATNNIELPKKIPISIVPMPIMQTNPVVAETPEFNEMLKTESSNSNPVVNVNDSKDTAIIDTDANLENDHKFEGNTVNVTLEDDINIDEKLLEVNYTVNMDENNLSPLSTGNEPMECSNSLASQISPKEERKPISEDVVMAETSNTDMNNFMQVESSEPSPLSNTEMKDVDEKSTITMDDLLLLCDLFYLPFEHGGRGVKLLNEFNWLKAHASVLLENGVKKGQSTVSKPEVTEWMTRADGFAELCISVQDLVKKIAQCANKEICHDLFSYIWDIAVALTLLNAFIKWLSMGHFPKNVYSFTQGTYTWFSKGWREAFMSGEQEPWVFRGGLIADLQRLMPVDSGNDLFLYKLPELPTSECYALRPFMPIDENEVNQICTRSFISLHNDLTDNETVILPDNLKNVIADSIVGHFITLNPKLCFVALDSANSLVGYIAAALDVSVLTRNVEVCWIPDMQEKYTLSMADNPSKLTLSKKFNVILVNMIKSFYNYDYKCPTEVSTSYPAVLTSSVLENVLAHDHGIAKRLLTVALAALRANGCFGVHVRLPVKDTAYAQYYTKMGFAEIYRDVVGKHLYLGRRF